MIITWTTLDYVPESIVEYGVSSLNSSARGTQNIFKNGIILVRNITMHQVLLTNLIPGQTYSK